MGPVVSPDLFLTLTDAERRHPLWLKLERHFNARLASQMDALTSDQTEQMTAITRGHIRCLREMLRLGQEPPEL